MGEFTVPLIVMAAVPLAFCNGQQFNLTTSATITTTDQDRNKIVAWFEDLSTDKLVLLVAAGVLFVLLTLVCVLFYICYYCCKRRYTYSPQRSSTLTPAEIDTETKRTRYGFAVSAARASISELSPTSQKCAPWSDNTSHQLNKVNNKVTRKLEKTVFVVENAAAEEENTTTTDGKQNGYRPRTSSMTPSIHSRESNIMRKSRKVSLLTEDSRYPGGPSSNDNPLCKKGRGVDLFY